MASRKAVIAVAVVALLIIAVGVVYIYPKLNHKALPATVPGTSFVAPKVIADAIGGTWTESFYVAGGEHNIPGFVNTYAALAGVSSNSSQLLIPPNETYLLEGSIQLSLMGYSQNKTGAHLFSAIGFMPNSTMASEIYLNFSAKIEQNTSVSVSKGTINGYPYVLANATYNGNETEIMLTNYGRYVIFFVYYGKSGVNGSSMMTLTKDEMTVIGSSTTLSYPSQLVSMNQMNSTIASGFNSEIYAVANVTGLRSLFNTLENTSTTSNYTSNAIEREYIDNITALGLAVFGNPTAKEFALSSFVTFNSSVYPSSIYEALNANFMSNHNFTYHSGTIDGKQYFYISGSISSNSTVNISAIFCLDGNSLIVGAVLGPETMSLSQMTSLASIQISDIQ